jgi:glycosyltransferase involved in cell wall biosynthesis
MLTPEFLPVYGGVGNYVLHIATNLPDDISVHVVTPRHRDIPGDGTNQSYNSLKELPQNVKVSYLGTARDTFFKNFSFQLNCSQFVQNILRREEVDIIHSQSAMPDFLISPKRLPIPIVTTMHTTVGGHAEALEHLAASSNRLSSPERFVLLLGPLLKRLESRYYTNQRYYVTVSQWARQTMIDAQGIDASRIRMINIGVDCEVFNPSNAERARARFPQLADVEVPKVLYLSRMAARKGINVLLKAIPRVLAKTDAHFIFAGSGKKPLFKIPEKSYTYLGYVPRDAPPYLYALSDIFVLPSLYENFPACVLEAMASQCAAVSTRVGGIPEMIEDGTNGMLSPADDVGDLADALIKLAEDKELRRAFGRRARASVIERFSWKEAAFRTAKYYEEVIDKHREEKKGEAGKRWRL